MNIYVLNVMSCQHEFKVDIKHYVTLSIIKKIDTEITIDF